ncbi:MAG: hypothetical protein EXS08_06155 [Planctomycetes bacterium]|nr:hypothetical protein [Planctomycetota bacterium]
MIALVHVLVHVVVLAQAAPQETPAPTPAVARLLDGVAVQAGEDVVTLSEYERLSKRYAEMQPPQNRAEEEQQRLKVLRELWVLRLEEQNGKDLGLDPAQIGRMRKGILAEEREKAGREAYLAKLKAEGKDALAEDSDRERAILRYLWEQAALGNAYAAKRATQDGYVRPGERREIFAQNKSRLAPTTVQLRRLIIASEHAGSPELARQRCEEARARAETGEDLAQIVEELGDAERDSRGLTSYVMPRDFTDPALAQFAEQAEVGALEILPLINPRTRQPTPEVGYQLVELHDRRVPPPPEFEAREIQVKLNEVFAEQRERAMLGRAREKLRRASYSWVSPLLTPASAPAPAKAETGP